MSFLTSRGAKPVVSDVERKQRISEEAAAFGQRIFDMEEDAAAARRQVAELQQRASLAEAQLARIKEEHGDDRAEFKKRLDALQSQRDEYFTMWKETQTKLRTAGNIILDAIAEHSETERFRPKPASMRAVEKALATRDAMEDPDAQRVVPDFIMAGPKGETK